MEEGSFTVTFNGGVVAPGIWVVPKNNPAGTEEVMKFIAHAQNPELQAQWLQLVGCGPANLATQIMYNDTWYAKNQISAEELYVDALIN